MCRPFDQSDIFNAKIKSLLLLNNLHMNFYSKHKKVKYIKNFSMPDYNYLLLSWNRKKKVSVVICYS